jgi:hypothetical protein
MALHLSLLAVFVFAFRYIPLQDYPEWLYHGVLFQRLVTGGEVPEPYELAPYVPPNAVSTIAIGALALLFEPELAGKVFLFTSMALLYAGIIRFLRITLPAGNPMAAWIAFSFVFNNSLWLANLSFYAGLGLALYGAHLMLVRQWDRSVPLTMLLVTAAYLSHFFAWCILLWIALISSLRSRDRARLRVLGAALLPSIVLLVHYLVAKPPFDPETGGPETLVEFLATRARLLVAAVIPMQRFNGVAERGALLTGANYVFALGLALAALLAAVRFFRERRWNLNAALALPLPLFMLSLPLFSSGIVFPAQRLAVFFLLNVLAYIALDRPRLGAWITGFFALFASLGFGYTLFFTARFDAMAKADFGPDPHSYVSADRGPGGTDGFLRLEFYDALRKPQALALFDTGLVLYHEPGAAGSEAPPRSR